VNIYQKLIEVRKEVPYLQKENTGAQYKYVSSSQVLSNCKIKMDELGLLLIPRVTGHKVLESAIQYYSIDAEKKETEHVAKRTTTYFTELDMTMTWVNAENPEEMIECKWYGQGVDIAGEKGVGKAMTYAEKYFMLKFFNIPTDKDDPDSFQKKMDAEPPAPKIKPTALLKPAPPKPAPPKPAPPAPPAPKEPEKIGTKGMGALHAKATEITMSHEDLSALAKERYKVDSLKDLTVAQGRELYTHLSKLQPATK
jgi:hypothetical protein